VKRACCEKFVFSMSAKSQMHSPTARFGHLAEKSALRQVGSAEMSRPAICSEAVQQPAEDTVRESLHECFGLLALTEDTGSSFAKSLLSRKRINRELEPSFRNKFVS
jgi:hypothetical protein